MSLQDLPWRMQYHLRDSDPEDVFEAVREKWDLDTTFFPIPKFVVQCPICRDHHPILRAVSFHIRKESEILYRCDVGWKCVRCSYAWSYGVPITDEMWDSVWKITGIDPPLPRKIFTRREVLEILKS